MPKRNIDPGFDPEEIDDADPLGEQAFDEAGFADAPGGGPDFSAPGWWTRPTTRRPAATARRWPACPRTSSTS
jgi:hypothetical protein